MTSTQRKQALRHDIMNVIKANNLEVTGEFWFMLIFRTESELKEIARGPTAKLPERHGVRGLAPPGPSMLQFTCHQPRDNHGLPHPMLRRIRARRSQGC
jgi:hypothetical protein